MAVQNGKHSPEKSENISALLLRLVKSSAHDESISAGSMKQIFEALDINGDGQISWWEWKNVLSSAIVSSAPFIDTMDPLLLQMKAAVDSLLYFKKHNNAEDDLFQYLQASQPLTESGQNSKLLHNLQSTVRILRETNNILSLRCENALLDTTPPVEVLKQDTQTLKYSEETALLESRLKDAELQSASYYDAFLKTKKKLDEISTFRPEPTLLKKSSDAPDDPAAVASRDRLQAIENEISANKKKLADLKAAKEKKAQCMAKLIAFLRKYFVPYCIKRKKRGKLNTWWTLLSNGLIALRNEQRFLERREMIMFECEENFMKEFLQEKALLVFLERVRWKENAAASVIQSAEKDRYEVIF